MNPEPMETQMGLFETIRRNASRRASYARTVREIRNLPLDTALDLDIDRGNAEQIAYAAVYGK
jgi:hypothetical protein